MSRIQLYYRDIPAGAGINGATLEVRRHIDNALIIDRTTGGSGARAGGAAFTRAEVDYPGPVFGYFLGSGQVKQDSGTVIHQVGPYFLDDVPNVFAALGEGPFSGLAASVAGSMDVSIQNGAGIFHDGLPYVNDTTRVVVTLAAADPSHDRIDRVVLRVTRRGQGEEGKFTWLVITGTPDATPLAPDILRVAESWDFSFAQIRVPKGAVGVSAGNLTDERYSEELNQAWAFRLPANLRVGDLLYVRAGGVLARLGIGADAQVLAVDAATDLPKYQYLTERGMRGLFPAVGSQSAADTTDTTNTSSSVPAMQLGVHLPPGTWSVAAMTSLALLRDTAGSSYVGLEVEGDEAGRALAVSTTDYQTVTMTRNVSGLPGNQDIFLRSRFRSNTSGQTHARNPLIWAAIERTN